MQEHFTVCHELIDTIKMKVLILFVVASLPLSHCLNVPPNCIQQARTKLCKVFRKRNQPFCREDSSWEPIYYPADDCISFSSDHHSHSKFNCQTFALTPIKERFNKDQTNVSNLNIEVDQPTSREEFKNRFRIARFSKNHRHPFH